MLAQRPGHHGRSAVVRREEDQGVGGRRQVGEQPVDRPRGDQHQGGVEDVLAGEPPVHPRGGLGVCRLDLRPQGPHDGDDGVAAGLRGRGHLCRPQVERLRRHANHVPQRGRGGARGGQGVRPGDLDVEQRGKHRLVVGQRPDPRRRGVEHPVVRHAGQAP